MLVFIYEHAIHNSTIMNHNFKFTWLTAMLVATVLMGCTSQKRLTYFRDVDEQSAELINKEFKTIHETRIVTGDMLNIFVTSSDMSAAAPFDLPAVGFYRPGVENSATGTQSYQPYMVDINGNINMPILGLIHIAGLTKSQAHDLIVEKLKPYLKEFVVTINYVNYKVSVLGEVKSPGQYTIYNERVSIPDALSLAGDLTPYGRRNDVLIIRETNGQLEFHRVNLNDDQIFRSPYYFLQQNDIVYVSPNKVRAVTSSNISIYLSIISTLVTLTTLIVSFTKK